MRCRNCAAEVAEGTAVCPICGISLTAGMAGPSGPAPGAPARPLASTPTPAAPYPRQGGETIAAPPAGAGWAPAPGPAPYAGAPARPQGGGYPPQGSAPYGPPPPQPAAPSPYGQPAAPPPGWAPGQPYPQPYGYPARQSAGGLLSTPAARVAGLLAIGGLLFWVFSFLPWISISVPGRSDSSSYKDVVDDLNLSNGYIVVMFLVGAMALGAAALRFRTPPGADPVWARLLAAGAAGAAVIVTILQFLQHGDLADRLKASADPQVRALLEVGMGFGLFLLPVACVVIGAALWLDRPTAAAGRR